jgi:hypothetical protein
VVIEISDIKVWNSLENRMMPPVEVEEFTPRAISEIPGQVLFPIGAGDREERPIYQGDIIAVYDWGKEQKFLGYAVVHWDTDELGWGLLPKGFQIEGRYDLVFKAFPRCSVVGNIFENPDFFDSEVSHE